MPLHRPCTSLQPRTLHDLDLYCPVPSGFGPACALMLQEWRDEHGMDTFASKTEAYIKYIRGFTSRSYANLALDVGRAQHQHHD